MEGLLNSEQVDRYSRQVLCHEIGPQGQRNLIDASVLIVGGGGLGSPLALYLAGSGIGTIGCIDGDVVERSNLHRQIAHDDSRIGMNKAESIAESIRRFNPTIKCKTYTEFLSPANAVETVSNYDVVVDASDNAPTRYLLNDACVTANKPLVSGSAMRLEGQLTVYNFEGGPCYRCLFPVPPPAATVGSCASTGVLGPVPGVIGCLQSIETIKILTGSRDVLSQKMLLYDAATAQFRNVKLRPKQPSCPACGKRECDPSGVDYSAFCGSNLPGQGGCGVVRQWIPDELQIKPAEYNQLRQSGTEHLLLDVRDPAQFQMVRLPGAVGIPLAELRGRLGEVEEKKLPVYVMCRRGGDSQTATDILTKAGIKAINITGGIAAWSASVDSSFPSY